MLRVIGTAIGATFLVAATLIAVPVRADNGVKVGVLSCNVESGWGFILASSKDIRCNYVTNGGTSEHYEGSITKVGVDIGYTSGGVIIWNVIAPTSGLTQGALEGSYGGVTASATLGVGVGANVLVGGSEKSITLQPVSIEGNTGLNVAAGVGGMELKFDKS